MTFDERAKVNSYIDRSFRDIADNDYIAARAIYRLGLSQQFLWASLQALEKYIKAILLYNDKSTKDIGHDIALGYDRLSQIVDIDFDIPSEVEQFIRYLSAQGANRYFERPFYTLGEELLYLDSAVWHLRRYCKFLRMQPLTLKSGKIVDQFQVALDQIKGAKTKPNKFRIFGGRLEKVLSKSSRTREHLVWKNFYYGGNKKKIIRNFTKMSSSATPANFIFPEIFPILDSRIKFSPEVRKAFQS